MENILMACLEKDMNLRPGSVGELRAMLMALPVANDWTPEVRNEWWDNYERQAAAPQDGGMVGTISPTPTISIDLSNRVE